MRYGVRNAAERGLRRRADAITRASGGFSIDGVVSYAEDAALRLGRPTGAESGCARAASPEAVEPGDQLDAGRSNDVRRKEKNRPGMRVWRAGDKDRDEAAAQRFGLNAELPSPFHGHEDHGVFRDLGDAQRACGLLLQIVVPRNLRQQ